MASVDEALVYTETGNLFRHYLGWREKLLGGYFAVIAALALAFVSPVARSNALGWVLAVVGVFLSIVFWALEHRNRELFLRCVSLAARLEQSAAIDGCFTELDKEASTVTHSWILDAVFGLGTLTLLIVAVMLWGRSNVIPT